MVRERFRLRSAGSALAPLAAASLFAAGCGGGSGSPGIASVASPPATATTTTTTTQSGPGPGNKELGGQGGQFNMAMNVGNAADGEKFAACMRKHGVQSFPDPNGQGVIAIHSGMGIDPGSPTFTAARSACEKLLPNGGRPTPAQQAQRQQEMLAFSKCMRAHGIEDFPDPTSGGIRIRVTGPGSDLNPNSAQFQAASRACQGNLPFKFPGGAAGSKSGGGSG
jgi:hypothetical protein